MKIKKYLTLAAFAAIAAVAATSFHAVIADSLSITFEAPTYTTGTINGQNGWSSLGSAGLGCAMYDHAVYANGVSSPTSFGAQSLRISNAFTSGCFGDQTFSKSLTNEAGETAATNGGMSGGVRQKSYQVQFSIASVVPTAQQPGLFMSTSPDRGDGARMGYLGFEDLSDGIHVYFYDYQDLSPFGTFNGDDANGCDAGGDDFIFTDVATLNRSTPHTIKLVMNFVDGPRNDVVKVYIDGVLKKTGTSWEDYFRYCAEQSADNTTHTVDSQIFRSGGTAAPTTFGQGYLIDNLNTASSIQPANADQCKNNGWPNYARADGSIFKNQGDCIQYANTGK